MSVGDPSLTGISFAFSDHCNQADCQDFPPVAAWPLLSRPSQPMRLSPMLQECTGCPTQCVFVKPWKWASMARMPLKPETGGSCWSLSFTRWAGTAAWCATMTTPSASPSSPGSSASMSPCPQRWRSSHLSTKVRSPGIPECTYSLPFSCCYCCLAVFCCHFAFFKLAFVAWKFDSSTWEGGMGIFCRHSELNVLLFLDTENAVWQP